jgi:hypothetical protein
VHKVNTARASPCKDTFRSGCLTAAVFLLPGCMQMVGTTAADTTVTAAAAARAALTRAARQAPLQLPVGSGWPRCAMLMSAS